MSADGGSLNEHQSAHKKRLFARFSTNQVIKRASTYKTMPGGAHANMKAWTPNEDALILDLAQTLGSKWKRIAEIINESSGGSACERTVASLRNRYQRIKKGQSAVAEGGIVKNKCGVCGQLKRGHVCRPQTLIDSSSEHASEAQ